jgi:hypothetical protein
MPGSSTTPGRPGARVDVPVRVAVRLRRRRPGYESLRGSMAGLCTALPTLRRRLYGLRRTLRADMDRYSFIVSDLHRLLITGLPSSLEAHKRVPKQIILDLNARDDPLHSLPRR